MMLCRDQEYRTRGLDAPKGKENVMLGNPSWCQRLKLGCDADVQSSPNEPSDIILAKQNVLLLQVAASVLFHARHVLEIYDWVIL